MGGIFISYRREDSQGEALHLFDKLKDKFGPDRVFMDVTGIEPGKDFRKAIDSAMGSCDVLIALIGKKWLDSSDEAGKRRIDNPKDFVRMETAAALHRDIPVIPVLVQDKAMPHADELPTEIEALAWRNAFEIRHNRWDVDVAELVKALEKIVSPRTTSATTEAAISCTRTGITGMSRCKAAQFPSSRSLLDCQFFAYRLRPSCLAISFQSTAIRTSQEPIALSIAFLKSLPGSMPVTSINAQSDQTYLLAYQIDAKLRLVSPRVDNNEYSSQAFSH